MTYAIETSQLAKSFGATHALAGVDLAIRKGSVYGLLGPNGAGKTTTVRILATLLRPDRGRATVLGLDVVRDANAVRQKVSLTGQYASVDEDLTGQENLVLFARLLGFSWNDARRRAAHLLEAFGLSEAAGRQVLTYSGGMRRRLDIAGSLLAVPEILFLDEPTTGLDPRGRNQVWDLVRRIAAEGTTVLLTTQYLDEADRLADRISVVDNGRVVASGSPDELKSAIGGDRVEVVVRSVSDLSSAASLLAFLGPVETDVELRRLSVAVRDRSSALVAVVRALDSLVIDDVVLRRPTLDEAFLSLTGRP
jgi:ABC-2 type transport system ATP-binding protein